MLNWFPGHMAAAKREIAQAMPKVDLAVEVLDARIPQLARNDALADLSGLEALSAVSGDLSLTRSPALASVEQLVSLDYVGGRLSIFGNTALGDAAAWAMAGQIHTVVGDTSISGNQ